MVGVRVALGVAGLGLAALVAGVASAAAQDARELRVAMEVDTTMIHLGDPVAVRLAVDHPADWVVLWADSLAVAPFEVLHYAVSAPGAASAGGVGAGGSADEGGGARSLAALTITSFELGELEIPPIEVAVAAPDGMVHTVSTDPFRIGVESVGLDESGDIREIKAPLTIARSWWALLPWLLLAAALGAGALQLHRRMQARPSAEIAKPQPPPRPHHLVALKALDELERSSLLERGQVKRWHVRVSEIIRAYVEGQLEVPALEMTTGEVVLGLRTAALGARITDAFHTFLARCDLVKFAKLRPGVDASRELLGAARSLVEMTSGPAQAAGGRDQPDGAAAGPDAEDGAEVEGDVDQSTGHPTSAGADGSAEDAAPVPEAAGGSR